MNRITDYLNESNMQYFATIGLDGKPKVRPFKYMFEEDGKLWFCTSNQKEVYKELEAQPYIELCASGENMSWIRLEAKVVFANNNTIKERIFEISPLVKGIYKETTNPTLEVFYLDEISASINHIGKPVEILQM